MTPVVPGVLCPLPPALVPVYSSHSLLAAGLSDAASAASAASAISGATDRRPALSTGYAKGGRERDSTKSRLRAQNERAAMLATRFSTNSRALSHDRAMLARFGSWTNGTATCVGLSTYFLGRRSWTGKLPAMSDWRYLSSREVHFLSRTRPWHTHSHAHLCSCLEALHRDGCNEYPRTNFDIACNSG